MLAGETADRLRRTLTLGLQGTGKKLNLFQEISIKNHRCWKELRDRLVQCLPYVDAEMEAC